MAYIGYLAFDDTEIINVARTEKYASVLPWFKPVYKPEYMEAMLGEDYGTPLSDNAPWLDPDNADSFRFYGVYPLEWTGFEDSTREASVFEFTTDGGNPGRIRHKTRSVVVSAILLGEDEYSMEYGFKWLKRALMGDNCNPTTSDACWGRRLRFFSGDPYYDPDGLSPSDVVTPTAGPVLNGGSATTFGTPLIDGGTASTAVWTCLADGGDADSVYVPYEAPFPCPFVEADPIPVPPVPTAEACLLDFQREFRNVVVTSGPTITAKRSLGDGAIVWTVQWTAVAGNPFEYTYPTRVLNDYLVADADWFPFGDGTNSAGWDFYDEVACPAYSWGPFFDPYCPALVAPPGPPAVPLGCYETPDVWKRFSATINRDHIPLWSDVVPYLSITASETNDARGVRIRFYKDDGSHVVSDECVFDGEFFITTIPAGMTLYIDGAMESVYIDQGYGVQRADSLVIASDGTPAKWFGLSCGDGYIMTVDLDPDDDQNEHFPGISLDLIGKVSA